MKQTSEYIKEYHEIEREWSIHDTSNTCSICDSPKGHTSVESWLEKTLYEITENLERERSNDAYLGFESGKEYERTRILGLPSVQDEKEEKGNEFLTVAREAQNALRRKIKKEIQV